MSNKIIPAESQAFCACCGQLVLVLRKTLQLGQQLQTDHMYQNKGQAPWRHNERLICRNCRMPFSETTLDYQLPFEGMT